MISDGEDTLYGRCTFIWFLWLSIAAMCLMGMPLNGYERSLVTYAPTSKRISSKWMAKTTMFTCSSSPPKGGRDESGEQSERRVQPFAEKRRAGYPEAVLERGALVAVLICFKPWRCPDQHRAPVHRTTTNAPLQQGWTATPSALSFPALNDGACRTPGQTPGSDVPPWGGRGVGLPTHVLSPSRPCYSRILSVS